MKTFLVEWLSLGIFWGLAVYFCMTATQKSYENGGKVNLQGFPQTPEN